jgi:hypothetical protein
MQAFTADISTAGRGMCSRADSAGNVYVLAGSGQAADAKVFKVTRTGETELSVLVGSLWCTGVNEDSSWYLPGLLHPLVDPPVTGMGAKEHSMIQFGRQPNQGSLAPPDTCGTLL